MASDDKNTPPNGDDDKPQYMSVKEVTDMVTGANERMRKTLEKTVADTVAAATKGLAESLPALLKTQLEALKSELPKPDDKPTDKPDPKYLALEQQVIDLKKAAEASATAQKAAEEKARNEGAKNALRAGLSKHVRPDSLEVVTDLLFDARKKVSFGEDNSALFKVRRSPYTGAPEEDVDLPLTDGIAAWLKSDDAKMFLPAPGGGGGDDKKRGNPRATNLGKDGLPTYDAPATTDEERVRRADERAAALAEKYPHLRQSSI